MGKAQSKRSVDITTETKKGAEDEITEKMEKIEDLDKKEVVNGDATISEKNDQEKKEPEEVENDKDLTTEKDVDAQASGDSGEQQIVTETSKEESGSANAEDISPLADESIKKSKKEKVKKKWSFRSISFGKKDKQKPAKNEEAVEDGSAATNGADAEEKLITEPEDSQKDKSANENEEKKTTETHENGNATPQEINGGEQNEEKTSEEKSNDITANTTNNTTTTTETSEPVQNETAAVSSEISEKTENTAIASSTINNETNISENATVGDASKNGNGIDEQINRTEQEPQKTDVINASVEAPSEKASTLASDVTNESASTNGEVVEKIHQNGDHGEPENEVIEKSKAQIEVNSNTDNKVSDATLDSISSTSINPSNVQIHVQDLNASSEKPDETIQIRNEESCIQNSTDIEVINNTDVAQSSLCENDSVAKDIENTVKIDTVENDQASDVIDTEKLSEDKNGAEPSPPPLPISPPPSQVSVFAFTNDESVEDSIETKNSEPSINNVVEGEGIPPTVSELPKTDIPNTHEKNTINTEIHLKDENISDQKTQTQVDEVNKNFENEQDEIKESQEEKVVASICQDMPLHNYGNEQPVGLLKESQNDEEVSVAVASSVINEITEKAAEIVTQQQISNEDQISDEPCSQKNEDKGDQKDFTCNDETISENTVLEHDIRVQSKKDQHDAKELQCELTNSAEGSTLFLEEIVNVITECSQDFSASNSIQQDHDEMMIPQNKSDILDEDHLNPTKEFANAKDIKDNVTVAEITQDLSVTCE